MGEIGILMGAESGSGLVNLRALGPFWVEGTIDGMVYKHILSEQISPSVKGVLPWPIDPALVYAKQGQDQNNQW